MTPQSYGWPEWHAEVNDGLRRLNRRLKALEKWFAVDSKGGNPMLLDVMARTLAQVRHEARVGDDQVRAELGLPAKQLPKPRVRVPAGRGGTW